MFMLTCNVCAYRDAVPPRFSGRRVACPRCGVEKRVPRDESQHGDFGWKLVPSAREGAYASQADRN
jgi:hypothetical protein